MCIKMKAKNNQYTFIMDEEVPFLSLMNQLESLLDQSVLKNIVIYPQAFFDFKNRIVSDEQIEQLINLLFKKQVLLFGGILINKEKPDKDIQIVEKTIHGGEIERYTSNTLLVGNINPGGVVECDSDFYVLGKVSGTICSYNKNSIIHCQNMKNGNILISDASLQNITSFAPMKVYYKDKEIICCKGDMSDVENNCSNIGERWSREKQC